MNWIRGVHVNYRELACIDEKLPRLPRKSPDHRTVAEIYTDDDDVLYPINLVESDGSRVLIHYVGLILTNGGRKKT